MQILLAFMIFVGIFTISAFASASSWEVEKSVKQYHSQGLIPISNNFKFEFEPQSKILTDAQNDNYENCSPLVIGRLSKSIWEMEKFAEKYSPYFSSNFPKSFEDTDTGHLVGGKEVYSSFEEGLIEFTWDIQAQHHQCLFKKNKRACEPILKIVSALSDAQAATVYEKGMEKTDVPYTTIDKFLSQILVAYSSAIQILGDPSNHGQIGRWFKATIEANIYDAKRGIAVDLFRSAGDYTVQKSKFGCIQAAQNHSVSSSQIVMGYGAIWNDKHMFTVGIDALETSVGNVNKDGAFPCEVARGSNSMFYSGKTIHLLLQIIRTMRLQGLDETNLIDVSKLHKAVDFQIDVGLNPSKIDKYTKKFAENQWCVPYQNISGQCMYQRPKRNTSFGWIQLYRKLYPEHTTTDRLTALLNEFQGEQLIDPLRLLSLNAIFQPNQLKDQVTKNYIDIIEDWERPDGAKDDDGMKHFYDSSDGARGSPLCLYGLNG